MTDPDPTSNATQALANYHSLRDKVDEKSAAITRQYQDAIHCKRGCYSCCKGGLTIFPIEAHAIATWVDSQPGKREELEALAQDRRQDEGKSDALCQLLRHDGSCAIYAARPLICRSHGMPLKFKDEGRERRDVCPLNFGGDLAAVPDHDVINLEILNTLLALISRQWSPQDERVPLETSWRDPSLG